MTQSPTSPTDPGTTGPILEQPPASAAPDDLLEVILEHCAGHDIEPYAAQLDAFDAIAHDRSVVLNTPTGSGKSLVAQFAHLCRYWTGWRGLDPDTPEHLRRSVYTAPIKALVNEKFFDLCRAFGSRNVGLATGDATVNAGAPLVCCTAEVLAKIALRQGPTTPFGWVIMDEFHYYGDRERGTAWLIPLLAMPEARYLLMSATLKDPEAIRRDLARRTGAKAVVVRSDERPVPLEFEYRDALLLETIESIRLRGLAPAYIVSTSKREAAELATQLRSTPLPESLRDAAKMRGKEIGARLERHRLVTPFGKKLERLLRAGIGVHHSGMLPKYRRLVERLARDGLVALICGTDTLGVGVNLPIRSVVFRQLYKFDGRSTRIVSAQEFHQVAGRAGRKGHDEVGTVLVQAPEHEVRNTRDREKAAQSGRLKKFRPESPPRNFKGWNGKTLEKLREAKPADLVTRFEVTGPLLLQVLGRAGDGWAALEELIRSVDEDVEEHLARAREILDAFVEAGLVRRLETPDDEGRHWDLSGAAHLEASFDRPLGAFLNHAVAGLDPDDPDHALNVLSVVESILDDPPQILRAQARRERQRKYLELRSRDQSLEEKIAMEEALDATEHPQPLKDEIAAAFRAWTKVAPFIADREPAPKSIARDLVEHGDGFGDFVHRSGLIHEEGTLLRYLSDAFRLFRKSLHPALVTDDVRELVEDLGAMIHAIDTSVVDEWERFEHEDAAPPTADEPDEAPPDPSRSRHLLRRLARNRAFAWVQALARRAYDDLDDAGVDPAALAAQLAPYWAKYESIDVGPDARATDRFTFDEQAGRVEQTILDPHGDCRWTIRAAVDLDRWRDDAEVAMVIESIAERGLVA